ncbi:MAG: hypothetical protein QOH84_374 [Kribbellaceae bacterium]|nr:hypothetical protein [Kribbellaceae bacterium]
MKFPDDVPVLTDGVIRLRAPHLDDLAAMVEMNSDPETQRWNATPVPYRVEDAERALTERIPAGWRNGGLWSWAIETDGRYAGTVLLSGGEGKVGMIGFTTHPAMRGQGVATRAVQLAVTHAFDVLGWNRITWGAFAGNWGSRRVAWRAGFRHLITAYGGVVVRGEQLDEWIASIGRDDQREPAHPWWEVPVIETDRFRLRAFRDSDVDRTIEFSNDELALHWLSMIPQPFGRKEAERYIAGRYEGQASGDRITWVIADPDSDEMLGDVSIGGLFRPPDRAGGEIGYCAHPAARGRGLVTAAVGRVIEHAFLPLDQGGLGRRRLELVAARGNLASIKVALSNGFTQTGIRRAQDRRRDGSYEDLVTFDLLSEER